MTVSEKITLNVKGKVKNTHLPKSRPLLPLFEAVVNSIQAINATGRTDGLVDVLVHRETHQTSFELDEGGALAPAIGFEIIDNGRGFDTQNYKSFLTSDSPLKERQGGKGVGRFLWLKAYKHVRVESIFQESGDWYRRRFVFDRTDDGIEEHTVDKIERSPQRLQTTVSLIAMQAPYEAPKRIDTIAFKLLEHCLSYFLLSHDCPRIVVREANRGAREDNEICLNDVFDEQIKSSVLTDRVAVEGHDFNVFHVRLYWGGEERHRLHYCAHEREVQSELIPLPNLSKRLSDERGEFVWSTFAVGEFLDSHVNADRTGFLIDTQEDLLDLKEVTIPKLRKAIVERIALQLEPLLTPIREEKLAKIHQYATTKEPKYRILFKRHKDLLDAIPPDLPDEKLEMELHRIYHEAERQIKDTAQRLLNTDVAKLADLSAYQSEYRRFVEEANDIGKSSLADYVIYRRLILNLLRNNLQTDSSGSYRLEEDVHSIIFPLRAASDDVPEEHQNLWIVDERLTYHSFLASDKPAIRGVTSRPDIVMAFSHGHAVDAEGPYSSIVVVEFKRPGREKYDESPVKQILGYIKQLKVGGVRRDNGRPIPLSEGIAFFAYLVCDITERVKEAAMESDLVRTPDGEGYFGYNKTLGAYIEIISYSKMLRDAEIRNRVLFTKLGLPPR